MISISNVNFQEFDSIQKNLCLKINENVFLGVQFSPIYKIFSTKFDWRFLSWMVCGPKIRIERTEYYPQQKYLIYSHKHTFNNLSAKCCFLLRCCYCCYLIIIHSRIRRAILILNAPYGVWLGHKQRNNPALYLIRHFICSFLLLG